MNTDWGIIAWGLIFGILAMGYMLILACWPRPEGRSSSPHSKEPNSNQETQKGETAA